MQPRTLVSLVSLVSLASCIGWNASAAAGGPERAARTKRPPVASTPCFSGPPLVAATVFAHLDKYGTGIHIYDGKKPLPTARYGTCRVKKGALYTAENKLVAHINCGLSVTSPGVVNHLGLGIGAKGRHIIDREAKPGKGLICVAQGAKSSCWFMPSVDDDQPWVKYTVKARLGRQSVRGKKARAFFARQTISAFHVTMYCH